MTSYELTITAISGLNLMLTIAVIVGNRRQIDDLAERLAIVETRTERSPTHDDLSKIYDRINEDSRTLHTIAGAVGRMDDNMRMILSKIVRIPDTRI